MPEFFSITADDPGTLSEGKGEVTLNVTNVSGERLRGQVWLNALGSTNDQWLKLSETDQDFDVNETHQFTVQIEVPPGTAEGSYAFRPVVATFRDPNKEFNEGQIINFQVPSVQPVKKGIPWWVYAAAAAVLVLIIGGVVLFLVLRGGGGLEVPSLRAETETGATVALETLCDQNPCLTVSTVLEPSDDVEEGQVIRTDPPEGQSVSPGDQVTLFISDGPNQIEVPNVVGQQIQDAREQLAKLNVVEEEAPTEQGSPGEVAAQDPEAGTVLDRNSEVRLQVVAGPTPTGDQITVPNVVRLPFSKAQEVLEQADLQVRRSRQPVASKEFQDQEVVQQTPAAFASAPSGSTVVLDVAGASVEVPNVKGWTLPNALNEVAKRKLLAQVTGDQDKLTEKVVNTSPAPGSTVLEGSSVKIHMPGRPLILKQAILKAQLKMHPVTFSRTLEPALPEESDPSGGDQ